jgi:hypothetical protein
MFRKNKETNLRIIMVLILCSIFSISVLAANDQEIAWARSLIAEGKKADAYHPQNGYVPDEQTAIGIAVSVWAPIYGKEQIEKQKPYSALLVNGYWVVSGSLPENMVGGVAQAVIEKKTGQVIYVIHSK